MPVETFSEFLDVAGQCQGFVSWRPSAAKPVYLSGAGRSSHLYVSEETQVRASRSATQRSGRER